MTAFDPAEHPRAPDGQFTTRTRADGDVDLGQADATPRQEAIRARLAEATPGPWSAHAFGSPGEEEPSSIVVHAGAFDWDALRDGEGAIAWMPACDSPEWCDAELIAHAPEDIAHLLGEVERLEAEVASLRAAAQPGS